MDLGDGRRIPGWPWCRLQGGKREENEVDINRMSLEPGQVHKTLWYGMRGGRGRKRHDALEESEETTFAEECHVGPCH